MDHPIWFLVTGVFFVVWLLIPAILLHYRFTSVIHRYNEVIDAFIWRGVLKDHDILRRLKDHDRIPAWYYMKALGPTEAAGLRKEALEEPHGTRMW